jgi:hypothetical protein
VRRCGAFIACALLLANQQIQGCTVFFAFDGKLAMVGNNEDLDHAYTQMWTVPAGSGTYGVLYFGFGRGEYPTGGASLSRRARQALAGAIPLNDVGIEDTYGYPQQGINEKGLFFGGAQTEMVLSEGRKPRFDGVVVDHILRHCKNVREALSVIQAYDFPAPEGQLLFADPTGQSFIWEAGGAVLMGTGRYQIITNFLQSRQPKEMSRDRRYKTVDNRLKSNPKLSPNLVKSLLVETQQDITQYSLVFDLSHLTVDLYERRQFSNAVTIRIVDQLAMGPGAAQISALFRGKPGITPH